MHMLIWVFARHYFHAVHLTDIVTCIAAINNGKTNMKTWQLKRNYTKRAGVQRAL